MALLTDDGFATALARRAGGGACGHGDLGQIGALPRKGVGGLDPARPVVVEAMLLQVPAVFYFPGAGGVPFDEGIEYADSAANPFGGEPFPMLGRIAVAPIPHIGLGLAINDRLRRAAADDGSNSQR